MPSRIESLALIEASVWQELIQASRESDHDWHRITLATVGGDTAQARIVVLRETDAAERDLMFFTDSRSAKVAQLRANPRGTLLCWSSRLGWQLRLRASFEVETTGLKTSSRWARLKLTPAALDYLAPLPPGSPLSAIAEPERATREHFAVITARVQAIDWLELHADGHRRASFGPEGARWLQP
jgi:pyridoxamine 5'-phosphate oxidase